MSEPYLPSMRRTLHQALILLALSAGVAAATAWLHPRAPSWFLTEATDRWDLPAEGAAALGDDILWIDSRKESEFAAGHFPGAILLNEERWGDLLFEHQDRLQAAVGKPVVVYCDGSGCERSRQIAERLRELLGMEPVYVLRGDWRKIDMTMPNPHP
jgi:rhodanese-related sulfurtransferase